jgi:hypothetical protein
MTQAIWRFQCDPTGDDPMVTVFVGDVVNGKTVQNVSNPLQIKKSELKQPGDLFDIAVLTAIVAARPASTMSPVPPA